MTQKDYKDVLKYLSNENIGVLSEDGKTLKNISLSLSSIGKAAINKDSGILNKIRVPQIKFETLKALDVPARVQAREATYKAFLTVLVNGQQVKFNAPTEINSDNLMNILTQFNKGA